MNTLEDINEFCDNPTSILFNIFHENIKELFYLHSKKAVLKSDSNII